MAAVPFLVRACSIDCWDHMDCDHSFWSNIKQVEYQIRLHSIKCGLKYARKTLLSHFDKGTLLFMIENTKMTVKYEPSKRRCIPCA